MVEAQKKNIPRLRLVCAFLGVFSVLVTSCGKDRSDKQSTDTTKDSVRIVSWGGQFQKALMDKWIVPAARRCGIPIESESWNGDYGVLTGRITKEINDWDLVHVEAHYVQNPSAKTLFQSFPNRSLPKIDAQLKSERAVPVLEYGYVLAYRKDIIKQSKVMDWVNFFDKRQAVQRGVRDFPVGNIEIALVSLGRDPKKVLYESQLSRTDIERQVEDALLRFDEIKANISWWTTGDQLQRGLATGDTPITAAWSGRVLSAHRDVCGNKALSDCVLVTNPKTSFTSTDWWVIPKGAPHGGRANQLLECLFNSQDSVNDAKQFSTSQGYAAPIQIAYDDELVNYYLKLGSSSNTESLGRLDEGFWGSNYDWIINRWRLWRSQ